MMSNNIQDLLRIASAALSAPVLRAEVSAEIGRDQLNQELAGILEQKNGFFAFESALHVLPFSARATQLSVERWNSLDLWRFAYRTLAPQGTFFAQDLFGGQFALHSGGVFRFNPETAELQWFADSLEEWAGNLLADPDVETGWPLARAWQQKFGMLKPGMRLVPKIPFVLGGEYAIDNLHPLDACEAMKFYAELAIQIADLPEGASVRLRVVE
jgi:hypothetical protein